MRRKKFLVERTENDDILDALSIRVNQILKTEKKKEDIKDNVYFWLFKFLILLVYLCFINVLFQLGEQFGISVIYYFGISFRSILSFFWIFILRFGEGIVLLTILYKNLKIFMNSTYYQRWYSSNKIQKKKKEKLFHVVYLVLKYLSIPYLIILGLLAIFFVMVELFFFSLLGNGIYAIGLFVINTALFFLCSLLFASIQTKFFEKRKPIKKGYGIVTLFILLIGIMVASYEFGSYRYSHKLPSDFSLKNQTLFFDITDEDEIYIQSGSKFDNTNIYIDNTLEDKIRVELDYYETAKVRYSNYLIEDNQLYLRFDSKLDLRWEHLEDILKLSVVTLQNKTIYNYNLWKYPDINIYISEENLSKLSLIDYKGDRK